ncbi:MAG: rhodanese-like domain-containing protein [Chloroflexi bacterium]|nr:rhodanese-like domain-containing protein [Chloroflexota bacterium]
MTRKVFVFLLTLAALVGIAGCGGTKTETRIQQVSPAEAYQLIQQHRDDPDFVILDIRTPQEFVAGHIQGARNVDFYAPDFKQQLSQLPKDKTYLVYCNSGNRSGQAMPMFRELGFREVYELKGGIQAWYQAGYPLVSGQ